MVKKLYKLRFQNNKVLEQTRSDLKFVNELLGTDQKLSKIYVLSSDNSSNLIAIKSNPKNLVKYVFKSQIIIDLFNNRKTPELKLD